MSDINRREMCAAAAAFALVGDLFAQNAVPAPVGPRPSLTEARVFRLSELPAKTNANGGWSRAVLEGKLPTGEFVEVHQTMVQPGKMPHPPHRHSNSEFVLLREGQLDYLTDGKRETVKPGDVIYTASDRPHGMMSTGAVPAVYFVVSVGTKGPQTPVTLAPPA